MPEKRKYTSDEFLSMTDLEGRYELVSGEIYDMSPSPNNIHQDISIGLGSTIWNYIRANGGKCKVHSAPSDVKLDEENTVQPDLFVVCDRSKLDGNKCNGAPDWVIEIVSPSSVIRDMSTKAKLYFDTGVREYWIINPIDERVIAYKFDEPRNTGFYSFDDEITVGIYNDMKEPLKIRINSVLL